MSKSLLLHSLSLKDRILEPNKLPLNGHVWAYNKEKHSKEEFVGNCISMLSLLGMQDASIQWKEDILAFDAKWENRLYTVIISLHDDSLASEHYYFLGVWETPENISSKNLYRFSDSRPWNDEDLIKPDISYSVTVLDKPLQLPEVSKAFGSDFFGQTIYGGDYYLCGVTDPSDNHAGRFLIFPTSHQGNHARHNIQHALYSLRNLMALMGKTFAIHDATLSDQRFNELEEQKQQLSEAMLSPELNCGDFGELTSSFGECLIKSNNLLDHYNSRAKQTKQIRLLFESITTELKTEDSHAFRPLFYRMKLPFRYAEAELHELCDEITRIEKHLQILHQTLHLRILVNQQVMIETMYNNIKEEE